MDPQTYRDLYESQQELEKDLIRLQGRVANLEQWKTTIETRSQAIPGLVMGIISAATGLIAFFVQYLLAQGRPPTP